MPEELSESKEIEALVSSYRVARPNYEAFVENVATLLVSLLRAKDIDHLPLEKRAKTVESFRAKLLRPEKERKYGALADMTDLAGIRIVAYYEKDVERICELIKLSFEVDDANSSDKAITIEADRFGYLSKHFVVSYEQRRRDLPENVRFSDLKIELQVRTVVQHAWAAIDRQLRYNNEADIPRELRRRLFRISALLELADKEFSEVHTAITELRKEYAKGVRSGDLQIEINRDSIEAFLAGSDIVPKLRSIAAKVRVKQTRSRETTTTLVSAISTAGLKSIEEVDELLRSKSTAERKLAAYLRDYTAARKREGVSSFSMSDAFLVLLGILLSLSKSEGQRVLSKHPLGDNKFTKQLREAIDRIV